MLSFGPPSNKQPLNEFLKSTLKIGIFALIPIVGIVTVAAISIWHMLSDYELTPIQNDDGLQSWVGIYKYSEYGPGLSPTSMNSGVSYGITIFEEDNLYYADITADGWMTAMRIRAEVNGTPKQVNLNFVKNLPQGTQYPYDIGDNLLSLKNYDGELFTLGRNLSFGYEESDTFCKCFTKTDEQISQDAPYDFISAFNSDIRMIKKNNQWGHIHADGTMVLPQYDEEYLFITDYAVVKIGEQCAVIDKHGNIIYDLGQGVVICGGQEYCMLDFNFRIDKADSLPFHGQLVPFQIEGQWGLWSAFDWVIPLPYYQYISEFTGGYANVIDKEGNHGTIDEYGIALPADASVEVPKIATDSFCNWQQAYANYLIESDCIGFYIGDINNDGIPEVITQYDEYTNSGDVLCFVDNKLQILELGIISSWGDAGYLEETGEIILLKWYGHTQGTFGSVDFFLYEWTPNGYTEAISVIRESGYDKNNDGTGEYGQGYINGEKVDFEHFEIALAKMHALLEKSTWFSMTNTAGIENYFDFFMQWGLPNSR